MNQRLYLDFNATAPYSDSVLDYLCNEMQMMANPSSTHQSGIKAKKELTAALNQVESIFSGIEKHKIFFHSGASEGISTFFQLSPKDVMVYFESDHPAVHSMALMNEKKGATVIKLPVNTDGSFDLDHVVSTLSAYQDKNVYLNYTYIHNETGILWPLDKAVELKQKTNCFIHVDSAQVVGKIEHWNQLEPELDFYTFSSHKFGAIKGAGFSFVKLGFPFRPLIPGGGQQSGLRGGTQNVMAVETTAMALSDTLKVQNFEESLNLRKQIESLIESYLKENAFVVLKEQNRAVNTILVVLKKHKGDFAQIKFDMQGIDISYGSACASGSAKGSDTMRALGLSEFDKNIIRISFGPKDWKYAPIVVDKISKVLQGL